MNSDWYQKSVNALSLAGEGERTVEAYTRALRMLVQFHHGKAPSDISESDLDLHRRNVDHWSPNTRGSSNEGNIPHAHESEVHRYLSPSPSAAHWV